MKHTYRIDRLLRRAAVRREREDAYTRYERERLENMTDEQLLRRHVALQRLSDYISGRDPDNKLYAQVNGLITAGDYEGAWRILENRPGITGDERQFN